MNDWFVFLVKVAMIVLLIKVVIRSIGYDNDSEWKCRLIRNTNLFVYDYRSKFLLFLNDDSKKTDLRCCVVIVLYAYAYYQARKSGRLGMFDFSLRILSLIFFLQGNT